MTVLYQKIKAFFSENKLRFVLILCGGVVFAVGYGTGRSSNLPLYENRSKSGTAPIDYTTSNTSKPNITKKGDPNCPVKGNISSKNEKKYYLPTDRGYSQVKPEECFANETEARTAGFLGLN